MGRNQVWASLFADGQQQALRIDVHTNDVTVDPLEPSHFSPVAVTDDGVWFIGRGGLSRLDAETLEPIRPIDLPIAPIDASYDPASGSLWLVGHDARIVRVELR